VRELSHKANRTGEQKMKLQFEIVAREEGVNLYSVYSPCGIFSIWANSQKEIRETMKTRCSYHGIFVSSDSKMPECKCWCAECKENRK
jgi:hypothetical protein